MPVKSFKDLIVWQKAFELAHLVYLLSKKLPGAEKFSLANQLQRSAISIPSNIAEGYERNSRKEYIQFLGVARGSSAELEAQLLLTQKIYSLDISDELGLLAEVQKMLRSIHSKLAPRP